MIKKEKHFYDNFTRMLDVIIVIDLSKINAVLEKRIATNLQFIIKTPIYQ
jgi:hypothetical protein